MPGRLDLPLELEPWRAPIEASVKPFVHIEALPALDATVFESKFGGYPYLPPGTSFPMQDGEPMVLLAQIGWSQVPRLPGFPTEGMLQLFIGNGPVDSEMRALLPHPIRGGPPLLGEGWRAVWHETVGTEAVQDFSFLPDDEDLYSSDSPFELAYARWRPEGSRGACHRLRFHLDVSPAPQTSTEFTAIAGTDQPWEFFEQLAGDEAGGKALSDAYESIAPHPGGHQIGGYADFVQDDPRDMREVQDVVNPLLHLMQIVSNSDLAWGDSGVCHFLIRQDAVRRRAWDEGWFYWDCC